LSPGLELLTRIPLVEMREALAWDAFMSYPAESDDNCCRGTVPRRSRNASYCKYDNLVVLQLIADRPDQVRDLNREGRTPLDIILSRKHIISILLRYVIG